MLDSAIAASIQTQLVHSNYINLVSFVILYYDYALTLPAEVERFWASRRISWASSFFYINRYLALLGHVPVMVQYYWDSNRPNSDNICAGLASFHQYLAVVIQVIVGLLLIMRTYALYDRNIWVLLFVCACGLAVIIFGTWTVVAGGSPKEEAPTIKVGCVPPLSPPDAKRLASAWTSMLMFDVLIFGMTLYKSLRRSQSGSRPLIHVLLRDGTIYFGIMAIASLCNILSFHFSPEYERGLVTTFANIISSTMISRLMLNLRDPKLAMRFRGKRTQTDTTVPDTNYPVLSTVLEFTTFSDATTVIDPEAS